MTFDRVEIRRPIGADHYTFDVYGLGSPLTGTRAERFTIDGHPMRVAGSVTIENVDVVADEDDDGHYRIILPDVDQ